MMTAMQVNELGHLGDRSIGTRPPLRLRIATDPGRTSPIAADGTALITIAGAKVFCGDEELIDPVELDFHAARGLGGGCPPKAVIDGHSIQAVEFRWEPIEQSNQGLEFVGALSRMFARYYAAHTIEDREVVQLRAPLRPGWFAPLLQYDHRRHALPLWCIKMQPNFRGLEARRSL